jgi:hypothetical protein
MQTFGWYINRLRQMSFGEVTYRLRQAAVKQAQLRGFGLANEAPPPAAFHAQLVPWLDDPFGVDVESYKRAADQVIAGRISLFAIENASLEYIPRWNKDILSGVEAPLIFGKNLDYRDQRLVGDIKYLWEPNRHLQLVTLAQAYKLTNAAKYLHALRDKLESWFVQCPYPKGPNWASSLELGIRLINWAFVWQLIGGAGSRAFEGPEGMAFKEGWLASIYQHAHFIAGHLSRFSSANNHFIGELAGLFVAGCTWPLWKNMEAWRTQSFEMLVREALLQNGVDGVNREHAVYYQHYVMDFLLIAALAGRTVQIDFPKDYWTRLEAMMDFIASIMDVSGNVPMIGDADDGYAVSLSQGPDFCLYRSLLATGAVLFNRPDLKAKSGRLDDKTKWLLGAQAQVYENIKGKEVTLPVRRAFPLGGYYVLGTDFETGDEIRLVVDAGPLGYPSIAAHGHADALAFTLSIMGREFLIDPGTYVYHTKPKWRDYFRGTAAHNTVRVDEADQSVSGGNFMWIRHARARCETWSSDPHMDLFCGSHDGYAQLPDPVTHRREIRFDKGTRQIQITDTIVCRRTHFVERIWHFSEDCRVFEKDNVTVIDNDGCLVKMRHVDERVAAIQFHGDSDRPAGWISRRYNVKVPTTTLVWHTQIDGYAVLRTVIECPSKITSAKLDSD